MLEASTMQVLYSLKIRIDSVKQTLSNKEKDN